VKQRYQQMAEENRQKYDQDMANYRQQSFSGAQAATAGTPSSVAGSTPTSVAVSQAGATTVYMTSGEYGTLM